MVAAAAAILDDSGTLIIKAGLHLLGHWQSFRLSNLCVAG
jgi:thiamine phosphate synthase YjbQ (UPF0047 family)